MSFDLPGLTGKFCVLGDSDNSASNEADEDVAKKDLPDDDSDTESNSNSQSPCCVDVKISPIANGTPFIVRPKYTCRSNLCEMQLYIVNRCFNVC